MNLYTETFRTSFGPFSLAVTETDAIAGTAFGDLDALRTRLPEFHIIREASLARRVREQVLAYFAGERSEFELPLAPVGSEFQQRVWAALRAIPFGETRSYGDLARALGSAPRAVGRANATNPICLIVPCHRVIGADGSLTGFAFGEAIKRRLLEHERAIAAPGRAA